MSELPIRFRISKAGMVLNEIILSQDVIKIGRQEFSHLQINDESVSQMHAVIEVAGPGQIYIFDLGSASGTVVNGAKVNKAPIKSGDVIAIGDIEIVPTFDIYAGMNQSASPVQYAQPVSASTPPVQYAQPVSASVAPAQYAQPMAVTAPQNQYVQPQIPSAQFAQTMVNPGMQYGQPMMGAGMGNQFTQPGAGVVQAQNVQNQANVKGAPYRVVTQPAIQYDPNRMEDISRYATEVITMWQQNVIQVNVYKADDKKPQNFYVGEDLSCDFPLPAHLIKGLTKVALVVNHMGGGSAVTILAGSAGDVTFEDGQRIQLSDLIARGQAQASSEAPGSYSFSLPPKSRVKMDVGDFIFVIDSVPNPRRLAAAPFQFNWGNQRFYGVSFLIHFLIVLLAFFDVSDLLSLTNDFMDDDSRFVKYDLSPFEKQQLEEEKQDKKDDEGGEGKRHKLEEGQMGKRDAQKNNNRYAIKGPPDADPRLARDMAKEMAKDAGILQYLTAANVPVSPFGGEPIGVDPENALGALMGDQIGDNFGYGGLGLRGTGRGGGGTGEGTIGLGALGTIGHGGGGGTGSGYGRGAGGLGGRRGGAPSIRSGAAMVKGSLSKEVIRRIVHRHINEVKFCYERELAKRPDLSGRVSIKFIISGSGSVQMAAVADSTIGAPVVENCIAEAVRRWSFPQPEGGGIVIVTYPFQLEAGG
jgi:TonB family protein